MTQLKAYHRPQTITDALTLMARAGVKTAVMAGGVQLVPHIDELADEVVDLQDVGLARITCAESEITFGAMVTLQTVIATPQTPNLVREAAQFEGPNTVRNAATLGGVIAGADRESELIAALLVFEAQVTVQTASGSKTVALAEFLRDVPAALAGGLITGVTIATGGQTASARVARTPADKPIVAAAARKTASGGIKLALCGVAITPILVDPGSDVKAALNPPADFRGSTEYRRQMAATLTRRVLSELA